MALTRAIGIVGGLLAAVATPGCNDSPCCGPGPSPLTVTAVSPATGSMAGGTSVTITGTNFVNVTSVTIGGTELGNRTVVSSTQITGTTPAVANPGATDVIVTSSTQGSGTCRGCFNYESVNVVVAALAAGSSHTCALTSAGTVYCWGGGGSTPVAVSGALSFSAIAAGTSHTCGVTTSGAAYCWNAGYGSTLVPVPGALSLGAIAAGGGHTCGLTSGGTALCWGAGYGSTPVAVLGGLTFSTLAAGDYHTCGLTGAGAAYCWGGNADGQLGDGSTSDTSTPVAVSGGLSFNSLTANGSHTCALTSAGVGYCWGSNRFGQLGNEATTGSAMPVAVSGSLRFSAIAAGFDFTCGLTTSGAAYCWGLNGVGELGDGTNSGPDSCVRGSDCSLTPVAVTGGLSLRALAAGGAHTCALTSAEGALYCWGADDSGQLGVDLPRPWLVPGPVSGNLTFSALTADLTHTCGLVGSGAAYCWGSVFHGGLGDGSTMTSSIPVAVSGGLSFSALAAGGAVADAHTCGLTTSGVAYCWGSNDVGQLGDATFADRATPVAVSGGFSFSALALGDAHSCALTSVGAAYCWGLNNLGQLGNGTDRGPDPCYQVPVCSTAPAPVAGGLGFSALALGEAHSCGLTNAGAAYCWGYNGEGQLGNGSGSGPDLCRDHSEPCSVTPVAVAGGLSFRALAAGEYHTCGLTTSGAAYCWGADYVGQLGDGSARGPESCGSFSDRPCSRTPVAVSGGLSFITLALGQNHTCGLTNSGAAYCWGANWVGQLGDGSITNSLTPVPVTGGLSFSALAAGFEHTCGLTGAGVAYCWGSNVSGQLGRVTCVCSTVPVAVAPFGASARAATLLPSVDHAGAAAAGSLPLEARGYEGLGLRPALTSARPTAAVRILW